MNTTPPPLRSIVEPPTPRHGARFDSFGPYSLRKSPRFLKQRTPSPTPSIDHKGVNTPGSRRISGPRFSAHTYSPPTSDPPSPLDMPRKRSKVKTSERNSLASQATNPAPNMLPTPVKTPRKKNTKENVKPTARVLFPPRPDTIEEAMPTSRKKRRAKGRMEFGLDDFGDDESSDGGIEIFTDSKDKVPELDKSADNPFYESPGSRPVRDRKKNVEKNQKVQQVLEDNEGMVYVFRGKKIYKKFEDENEDQSPDGRESNVAVLSGVDDGEPSRRFTRSSIKPRLLFPNAENRGRDEDSHVSDDGEDTTDIEDPTAHGIPVSPSKRPAATTPVKKSFAPASPPTTARATRSMTRKPAGSNSSPAGPDPADSPSHVERSAQRSATFNGWQRTKPTSSRTAAAGKGKKRAAEEALGEENGKRVRASFG